MNNKCVICKQSKTLTYYDLITEDFQKICGSPKCVAISMAIQSKLHQTSLEKQLDKIEKLDKENKSLKRKIEEIE